MKTGRRLLLPCAAAAVATAIFPIATASAHSATTYSATLNPLNHSTGSGMLTLTLSGNTATIVEHWSGIASTFDDAPYPHVQHIHAGGGGVCPTAAADKNGDGVVSTTEGMAAYGGIVTTLSVSGDTSPAAATNLKIAPAGASTDYSRTITLSNQAVRDIRAGSAVVVVHGLDPATLSKQAQSEKSDLVPSLPLAATSPTLCGALTAMPGAPQTGVGSTGGTEDLGMFGLGGALLVGGGAGLFAARKRTLKNAAPRPRS